MQHGGPSLPRVAPWWPTQATPVLAGGQGQSWGTLRPQPAARAATAPCGALFQAGYAMGGTLGTHPIVSASHLLLPARGQGLGSMGHLLLLQPAGCAGPTRGTPCLLPLLHLPARSHQPVCHVCDPAVPAHPSLQPRVPGSPELQPEVPVSPELLLGTANTLHSPPATGWAPSPRRSLTEGTRWSQGRPLGLNPNMASSGTRHVPP